MSSQQATFVCNECKEIVHYDFNQKINEDQWKSLQDMGLPSNVSSDREKLLEQSFVVINENWEKLQKRQQQLGIGSSKLNKRRNLAQLSRQQQLINKNNNNINNNNNNNNINNNNNNLNTNNNNMNMINMNPINNNNNNDNNNNPIQLMPIDDNKSNINNSSSSLSSSSSTTTNNNNLNVNDFAQSLNVLEEILEICAGHAKISHPLCNDCTDKIMKNLDGQIEELNLEKKTLTLYINQWEQEQKQIASDVLTRVRSSNNYSIDCATRYNEYKIEASILEKKLLNLSLSSSRLQLEYSQLEIESLRMNEYEEMFFCDANDFWYSIENLSMQHSAVRQKIRQVSTHLDMMKRTNVFDDAFHIYHDGHFGTINGLRLGKLQTTATDQQKVEWEEINAGLGQCVLLLDVLAQRCKSKNFKFRGYELYPMGSFSYILEKKVKHKNLNKNNIHHMYGSTSLFGYKQCDKALECFLQCIKQFSDWMMNQDNKFYLRYIIKGHEIGDNKKNKVSIRFAGNTEENWTQALKYMVIDLKYLLAWVARYSP